ncbi:MAG: hypothetical protein LBR92_01255 [Puniceicoccales bacterium]|jgi:hypothetical protein|nr:hypothetical protein [Puniceicoccales bacterium]
MGRGEEGERGLGEEDGDIKVSGNLIDEEFNGVREGEGRGEGREIIFRGEGDGIRIRGEEGLEGIMAEDIGEEEALRGPRREGIREREPERRGREGVRGVRGFGDRGGGVRGPEA